MIAYPRPTNRNEVRRFLGLTGYYRRLINDYSGIASPLTDLLKTTVAPFRWSDAADRSFQRLKEALSSAPVVVNPDFKEESILQCDASDYSAAAVLGQIQQGKEVIIAFFSHKWGSTEKNWCATEKEAACVLKAIENFRSYLYGLEFTVVTDAQALTHIRSLKTDGSSRLSRWASVKPICTKDQT